MREFLRDTFRKMFPAFIAISLSICVFFLIFRFSFLNSAIAKTIDILTPFVYGGVIAYLLKRPYNFFERHMIRLLSEKRRGLAKVLSVIIVLAIAIVLIVVLLILVIPALANSLVSIANQLPGVINDLIAYLRKLDPEGTGLPGSIVSALETLEKNAIPWLKNNIFSNLTKTVNGVVSTLAGILGLLYNVLIGIIICIYVLLGKDTFAKQGKMLIYSIFSRRNGDWLMDEIIFIDKTFDGFFAGKILDSAIVGVICFIFCLIMRFTMGMSNILLISVVIGVTNIIPFFGPYIGGIPCALLTLMDGPTICIIFCIFIILLQQFDGNYLGPRCLSEGVGLSGFWVLFAITLFGGIMGIAGIIVGVPIFAVIYDLIRRCVHAGLAKHNITDLPVRPSIPKKSKKRKKRKEEE